MSIDIENENLIPFSKLPKWCEKNLGNRVHPTTLHRWRLRGIRGVKLETILAGGKRYTSASSLNKFFADSTAAADGNNTVATFDRPDDQAVSEAEEYLAKEGV